MIQLPVIEICALDRCLMKNRCRIILTFTFLFIVDFALAQTSSSNWNHRCDNSNRCFVYSSGATGLVFSKKPRQSNKSMRASVILPLGLAIGSPVTLHVGGEQNLALEVSVCNERLCEAQIQATYVTKLLEQLQDQTSLDIVSTVGGIIAIESIDMSGYAEQIYKI